MNRSATLHETRDLAVRKFDHPPHEVHLDPEHEEAERFALAFVQHGRFDVLLGRTRHRLSAGSLFLTRPGLAFRCEHDEVCPTDVCISIGFEAAAIDSHEAAWYAPGWTARETPTPRLSYVSARLLHAAVHGDTFALERWAIASLSALQADTATIPSRGPYAARRADVEAVVTVCESIEDDACARRSVADRAHAVGMTSPQLTHAFRRYLGTSPHQYVLRWRLAAAAEMLSAGSSVSESCYRAGFDNLSHFCRMFQRTFGVRASHWRTVAVRETRRKVQDFLRQPS